MGIDLPHWPAGRSRCSEFELLDAPFVLTATPLLPLEAGPRDRPVGYGPLYCQAVPEQAAMLPLVP